MPARASVLLAFLAASGSELVDAAGYYQFADEEGYASASYLQAVMTGDCGEVYENWDRGLSELSKSSMAMIVESSERLSDIEEGILAGRNFPLGLSPLPGVAGPGATVWYGPGLMVSAPPGARQEAALNVLQWFFAPEAQTIWGELTEYIPVQRSVVEAAVDDSGPEFLLSSEAQLWQLALDAADNETWFSWPLATNRITCRASLLRGLLALQQETADAGAYIDTAVTACNTGVGFRPIPTPTATEEASP